jgi:hypothetical protein
LETELIEHISAKLREIVPDIKISAVRSFVGENFWSFEIANKFTRGSGAALNAALALQKATSEFIERDAFRIHTNILNAKTSNGFAAHTALKDAHAAAKSELIERDALLICWFADIRPCWISANSSAFSKKILERLDYLERMGIQAKIGVIGKSSGDFVSVGMLNLDFFTNHNASWAFTTEAASSLHHALEKSALSLLRIANLAITRSAQKIALFSEIHPKEISKPEHHLEYHLNPKNRELLIDWWMSSNTEVIDLGSETVECIELKTDFATGMNRYVSFAKSANHIPYFVGIPESSDLICKRLSSLGIKQRRNFEVIHPLP